jgi:hypothetical protein
MIDSKALAALHCLTDPVPINRCHLRLQPHCLCYHHPSNCHMSSHHCQTHAHTNHCHGCLPASALAQICHTRAYDLINSPKPCPNASSLCTMDTTCAELPGHHHHGRLLAATLAQICHTCAYNLINSPKPCPNASPLRTTGTTCTEILGQEPPLCNHAGAESASARYHAPTQAHRAQRSRLVWSSQGGNHHAAIVTICAICTESALPAPTAPQGP